MSDDTRQPTPSRPEAVVESGLRPAREHDVAAFLVEGTRWVASVLMLLAQSQPSLYSFTPGAIMLDFSVPAEAGSCPCAPVEASIFNSPGGGFIEGTFVIERLAQEER